MKLKKVLALVLSAALVVSAFAGCGGNSSSSTASTESSTASESSAESTESTASGDSTPAASGDATAIFTPKTVDAAKTISLNAGMEPTGLNTLTSTYSIEFSLFKHMYENLVSLDDDDNTVPAQLRAGTTMRIPSPTLSTSVRTAFGQTATRLRRRTSSLLGVRL